MNAYSVLADLFRHHGETGQPWQKPPHRLQPITAADELPPYPEQLTVIDGIRRREPARAYIASDRPCARVALRGH
jgi:hypothetical protein